MRKLFNIVIIFILAQSALLAQKSAHKVNLDIEAGPYYIRSVANGKYLDIPGYAQKASKKKWCKCATLGSR